MQTKLRELELGAAQRLEQERKDNAAKMEELRRRLEQQESQVNAQQALTQEALAGFAENLKATQKEQMAFLRSAQAENLQALR